MLHIITVQHEVLNILLIHRPDIKNTNKVARELFSVNCGLAPAPIPATSRVDGRIKKDINLIKDWCRGLLLARYGSKTKVALSSVKIAFKEDYERRKKTALLKNMVSEKMVFLFSV